MWWLTVCSAIEPEPPAPRAGGRACRHVGRSLTAAMIDVCRECRRRGVGQFRGGDAARFQPARLREFQNRRQRSTAAGGRRQATVARLVAGGPRRCGGGGVADVVGARRIRLLYDVGGERAGARQTVECQATGCADVVVAGDRDLRITQPVADEQNHVARRGRAGVRDGVSAAPDRSAAGGRTRADAGEQKDRSRGRDDWPSHARLLASRRGAEQLTGTPAVLRVDEAV